MRLYLRHQDAFGEVPRETFARQRTSPPNRVMKPIFLDACGSVVTIRPTIVIVIHRNPARSAATCSYIYFLLPLLRFAFVSSSAALCTPLLWLSAPPLTHVDRTMPRTDRWSPDNSRGYYEPQRGTRDYTRKSGGHSAGHDRPRGRSAADEQRRGPRGRSCERSTLTRVRPSRRPTPSEMRDRTKRRERSRSRERSTLSRRSSRRGTTSLPHSEAYHTPGYSTELEQRSQSHSQSQNTLNASKFPFAFPSPT